MVTLQGHTAGYYGESTDEKPTGVEINTRYKELDTGDEYFFTGEDWEKIGGAEG